MDPEKMIRHWLPWILIVAAFCLPQIGLADFNSSVAGLKYEITGFLLPMLSVCGIAFAAISFFTGSPNAKTHIAYAVIGCVVGFGAQAIVDMLASLVR